MGPEVVTNKKLRQDSETVTRGIILRGKKKIDFLEKGGKKSCEKRRQGSRAKTNGREKKEKGSVRGYLQREGYLCSEEDRGTAMGKKKEDALMNARHEKANFLDLKELCSDKEEKNDSPCPDERLRREKKRGRCLKKRP